MITCIFVLGLTLEPMVVLLVLAMPNEKIWVQKGSKKIYIVQRACALYVRRARFDQYDCQEKLIILVNSLYFRCTMKKSNLSIMAGSQIFQ